MRTNVVQHLKRRHNKVKEFYDKHIVQHSATRNSSLLHKKLIFYEPFVGFLTVGENFNHYFTLGWDNPLQHIHRHPAGEHLLR